MQGGGAGRQSEMAGDAAEFKARLGWMAKLSTATLGEKPFSRKRNCVSAKALYAFADCARPAELTPESLTTRGKK